MPKIEAVNLRFTMLMKRKDFHAQRKLVEN
jgi:hypothetical protein